MGFVIGLIEISNWYKETKSEDYPLFFHSSNWGFISAVFIGSILNTYFSIFYVLGFFGIIALISFFVNKYKGKKTKAKAA